MTTDPGPTDTSGRLRQQWVVGAGRPGAVIRFAPGHSDCPVADGTWVEVRALTHREALERESVGVYEVYGIAEGGRELSLRRHYDFWAMAEYDYRHSLVAFQLPVAGAQTPDGLVASEGLDEDARVALLCEMPPALAAWVERCIDEVNLRDAQGLEALSTAQKN